MGHHEQVVALQTKFVRSLKSWNFESNQPETVVDRDTILIKWDQAMRPLLSNSRELSDNHWAKQSVPLQAWLKININKTKYNKLNK